MGNYQPIQKEENEDSLGRHMKITDLIAKEEANKPGLFKKFTNLFSSKKSNEEENIDKKINTFNPVNYLKCLHPRNLALGSVLVYTTLAASCGSGTPTNKAPIIQDLAKIVVTEGDLVDVNPIVSDPEGGPVTVTYEAPLDANGEWPTDYYDAGIHYIDVTAEDNKGKKATKKVEIEVLDDNRVCDLDPIVDIIVDENDLIQVTLNATDPDIDNTLVYSLVGFVKTGNNTFEKQTTYNDSGIYIFTGHVEDGRGSDDDENFQVTINDLNRPPVLVTPITPSPTPVKETEKVTINVFSNDADLDTVVHTIEPLGYFTKINNNQFEWNPLYTTTNLPSEQIVFTIKADDGRGGIDTEIVPVLVTDSRIVIPRSVGGQYDLFLINPDGSGLEQNITNTPGFDETNPQHTPDGEKVICLSNDTGNTEVYVIDLRTLVKSQFSADPGATDPKIGPNQLFVYFKKGTNIWKRDFPSGNNPVNITNHATEDTDYKISPAGDKMLVATKRYNPGFFQIAEIDLTTLAVNRVSFSVEDEERPCYHPGGQKAAWESNRAAPGTHIWTANINGSNDYALVSNGLVNKFPTFSDSGTSVIYVFQDDVRKQVYPNGNNIAITSSSSSKISSVISF